jgi:ADP-ribose pyrophosphatase
MTEYILKESRTLFDHPWVRICHDTLDHQGKRLGYFYLASPVEAVNIVGLTEANEIILTHQYRHPIGKTIYDLPGGRLNPGEQPLDGARREFEEETGFFPRRIKYLGCYNQFPGMLRAATNLYFANQLQHTQQRLDEDEELIIELKTVADVLAMILNGDFIDGSLQLGVLLALQKGLINVV